jgi:hypothetical protein
MMSADTVLQWAIFQGKHSRDSLINGLFQAQDGNSSSLRESSKLPTPDEDVRFTGLHPPDDERIPYLIDSFLQNVHTKNPILDVESLVKHGRKCAQHGVGWDGLSCLVLLTCALGSVAKPFDTSIAQHAALRGEETDIPSSSASSSNIYAQELQQAESCFTLACRCLGSMKHTILGAQCHFFAGG